MTWLIATLAAGCADEASGPPLLTADMPLHLEDHLDAATVVGSDVPADPPKVVEWRFDEPQPDWRVGVPVTGGYTPAEMTRTGNALRVTLREGRRNPAGFLLGAVFVDLPDWRREQWAEVRVSARTEGASPVNGLTLGLNPQESTIPATMGPLPQVFQTFGGTTPIVSDGSLQTYRITPNWGDAGATGPWRRIGLGFRARDPGSIEILSVSVVPTAAVYAGEPLGLRSIWVGGVHRRALFTHTPGRVAYRVRVPEGGRLDAALGVLGHDSAIDFRITAQPAGGEATTLLSETYADPRQWAERSVDLSRFAGQTITLALETEAATPGTVAFWGAPTVSGVRRTDKPNVIFYVFDGGAADYMSVYGYNRRTTPTLEKLAGEGAIFERAYSNSTATYASTPSFMTSLQDSVLGNPLPENAITMAERFHDAGYQTAVFTSNPWAGSASQLERGVDVLENTIAGIHGPLDYSARGPDSSSSRGLNEAFWRWREASAGEPYWVHFQSTDVHQPYIPVAPFAGLFVSPEQRHALESWNERLGRPRLGSVAPYSPALQANGIDRIAYFTALQGIYDEMMALNDYQLGRLVDRLRATDEWQDTLLIVTSDHGIGPATDADMAVATLDQLPPRWAFDAPMFRPSLTRVPLLVVWAGRIAPGQRFMQAVSLLDVLPTILDLVGLEMPAIMQGQSLAPLLRGQQGWTARPVVLDFFYSGFGPRQPPERLRGRLEVVDGQWGASMWIGEPPSEPEDRQPWPVLVYDLWNDPICIHPINEQRPDLVEKYTAFLTEQWEAHQALATRFTAGGEVTLAPEQLERLRALGYIR